MKKFLLILILVAVAARLSAQTPPQTKSKKPATKVDTNKQDRMPVIKPNTNSTMPVLKPQDNSRMPILKTQPDTIVDKKRKTAPKM